MDEVEGGRNWLGWLAAAVAVAGFGAAAYLMWGPRPAQGPAATTPPIAAAPGTAPAPAPSGEPQHPLPPPAAAAPLPALDASDAALTDVLARLLGKGSIGQFLYTDRIARRIVATVDNLPRRRIATNIAIAKPVEGTLAVQRRGDGIEIAADNAARYRRHVEMLAALDTRAAVAEYQRLYPLFQRAYQDLGYPSGYFNDRLVEVIDHLLAAPDAQPPVQLTQPKVRYEYADADLEALSAGEKIMLRIGPSNSARVKAKLRDLRAALAKPAR